MDSRGTRQKLVWILQHAHSGELAASLAYNGHWRSVRNPVEVEEIKQIEQEELHHRRCVRIMLHELAAEPEALHERRMSLIGKAIAFLCHVSGWFIPMYGAGRLERGNIKEYEDAARLAVASGYDQLVEELLTMAEVEWEHERYFREKVLTHWLRHIFPQWDVPPPKETIRSTFGEYQERKIPTARQTASEVSA